MPCRFQTPFGNYVRVACTWSIVQVMNRMVRQALPVLTESLPSSWLTAALFLTLFIALELSSSLVSSFFLVGVIAHVVRRRRPWAAYGTCLLQKNHLPLLQKNHLPRRGKSLLLTQTLPSPRSLKSEIVDENSDEEDDARGEKKSGSHRGGSSGSGNCSHSSSGSSLSDLPNGPRSTESISDGSTSYIRFESFKHYRPDARSDTLYWTRNVSTPRRCIPITAVIPFFNEEDFELRRTLVSLHGQATELVDYGATFHVCIILDGWWKASDSMKAYLQKMFCGAIGAPGASSGAPWAEGLAKLRRAKKQRQLKPLLCKM